MRDLLALAAAASCVGLGLRVPAAAGDAADLAPPFAVTVGGVPIASAHDRKFDLRDDNSFPWVGDFDGDGKLDLLVGDCVTLVSPAKGISDEEFKKKYADWEKTFQAALAAMNSARDAESQKKANEDYQKVYGQRSEFMREEMTGFVWLYLQK